MAKSFKTLKVISINITAKTTCKYQNYGILSFSSLESQCQWSETTSKESQGFAFRVTFEVFQLRKSPFLSVPARQVSKYFVFSDSILKALLPLVTS